MGIVANRREQLIPLRKGSIIIIIMRMCSALGRKVVIVEHVSLQLPNSSVEQAKKQKSCAVPALGAFSFYYY